MSVDEDNGVTVTPPERFAIGLSFGNSNSSIAHTSSVKSQPVMCRLIKLKFLRKARQL